MMSQVVQYTKAGSFVRIWASAAAISRDTGLCFQSISACLRGYLKTLKGYRYIHTHTIHMNIGPLKPKSLKGPVEQMDRYGNVIMTWPSTQVAADWLGASRPAISQCIHGHTYMSAGFKWRYKRR